MEKSYNEWWDIKKKNSGETNVMWLQAEKGIGLAALWEYSLLVEA